jgi:sterol desaturase/sphingolipid hydroxylase (fatty acid hydroxylase superfamily)
MNIHALYRGRWARPFPALATHAVAAACITHFGRPPAALVSGAPLGAFALGLSGWTLFEYALHRFAMHGPKRLWDLLHKEHHQLREMAEPDHFLMHPLAAVPLIVALGWLGAHVVPWAAILGFWLGYGLYEACHFMQHDPTLSAWASKVPVLRHNVGAHVAHHLRHVESNFGVTTALWDRVFGTYLPPLAAELPTATPAPA